ncbi:hypothetical protein FBF83_10845 [Pseudalkalibacillus hwajinpoensis]|uniref:Transposase n=1 Tax=Guptibacillus hwajinpoensis TaxID=208199 RepID=A0A4U1MG50_9BACL|nr:hypothetical protein FBF83_10845 [Pseudalkalibacillus hwajinpoensis]
MKNCKPRSEIIKEYELTPSSLDRWIGQFSKPVRSSEETERMKLRKKNPCLAVENDVLKQAALIHRTKVNVIHNNRHKYSVSAMCDILQLPRSPFYYEAKALDSNDDELEEVIQF